MEYMEVTKGEGQRERDKRGETERKQKERDDGRPIE
jgi:hypothetical protein